MKCFYHSADLDGKCSAAIVLRKYPECELIGINYGQPFPWDTIGDHEKIFMVDFSLQPFKDMGELEVACGEFVWIDHHRSAINEADGALWVDSEDNGDISGKAPVEGIREEGIGACVLTWRYMFPDEPVPRAVQLMGEYDVWDHHDPGCLPFQYGMRLLENDPIDSIWECLLGEHNDHGFSSNAWLRDIIRDGKTVLKYQQQQNKDNAKTLCFETVMGHRAPIVAQGLKLLAANTGPSNSQFFDSVWDPERYDAMCLFRWSPKARKWTVSLFTDKNLDLGAICKRFDSGGGHPKAAGFQCTVLPFELNGASVII